MRYIMYYNIICLYIVDTKDGEKMQKDRRDNITKAVAAYVKEKSLQIDVIAQGTGIPINVLKMSIEKGTRKLNVDEFLGICRFFNKDPYEFYIVA
jgi:hypothetical protein